MIARAASARHWLVRPFHFPLSIPRHLKHYTWKITTGNTNKWMSRRTVKCERKGFIPETDGLTTSICITETCLNK